MNEFPVESIEAFSRVREFVAGAFEFGGGGEMLLVHETQPDIEKEILLLHHQFLEFFDVLRIHRLLDEFQIIPQRIALDIGEGRQVAAENLEPEDKVPEHGCEILEIHNGE